MYLHIQILFLVFVKLHTRHFQNVSLYSVLNWLVIHAKHGTASSNYAVTTIPQFLYTYSCRSVQTYLLLTNLRELYM